MGIITTLNIPGIENGYKVDDLIWRGAQPADSAWALLAAAGCKAVIDLNHRGLAAGDQRRKVIAAGIPKYAPAGWNGILPPRQEQVKSLLAGIDLFVAGGFAPVFIHCLHGSDRTGTLCACWRIHHDRWKLEDAIEEAFTSLGLQGMHEFWMAAAVAHYATDDQSEQP